MHEAPVLIIAEAGVNHNGDPELALKLVDAAASAGADAVKFQSFHAEHLVSRTASKAEYQKVNTGSEGSQFEMLRRLELGGAATERLVRHCASRGIRFLSSPFDAESIEMLVALGIRWWKIPSGEITNLPYLRQLGARGEEILLSTGMADLGEIEAALGALETAGTPRKLITLLHCTTEYPAPIAELNLRALPNLAASFGVRVGYSDHTRGLEASIAAVALGARVIEKHFTLDCGMEGPDHRASLDPTELARMVAAIRGIESALGDGVKRPGPSELRNRDIARKCLVASRNIAAGEKFSEENLCAKRAGGGISPMLWDRVLGRIAPRDFREDEAIEC